MINNRKREGYIKRAKQLFVLFLGGIILISSANASTLPDTTRRRHPKPKSIKEIWTKINPFKKKNKDESNGDNQASVDPKPTPPTPPPPPPKPVTPAPKHKSTTKKKKTTTTDQPLI